jgi:hypothetical protein
MTRYAKIHCVITSILLVLCCYLSIALIAERSRDIIRFTVSSEQMYGYDVAPTAYALQRITGGEVIATPLGGNSFNAKRWRIQVERK